MSQIDIIKRVSDSINNCISTLRDLKETVDALSQKNHDFGEEPQDKIYLQLHEQYAINNNANLNTIITLVIALIGVIGYYGYVYIHTTNMFKGGLFDLYDPEKRVYYIEALILVYIASISILAILFCLCTYQGIAQRKEQFIIFAIRNIDKYRITDDKILPAGYNPYKKIGFEIIQGLYGELVKIFVIVSVVIGLATVIRILFSGLELSQISPAIIVLYLLSSIIGFSCICYFDSQYQSYIERQLYFSKIAKEKGNTADYLLDENIFKEASDTIEVYENEVNKWKRNYKQRQLLFL